MCQDEEHSMLTVAMNGFDHDKLNIRHLSKLYGRSEESSILLNAYKRVVTETSVHIVENDKDGDENDSQPKDSTFSSELVLVSGYSGTGKSTLVRYLRDHQQQTTVSGDGTKSDGLFASGKFELLRRAEPYSAIVSAFHDLFSQMLRGDLQSDTVDNNETSLKERIRDAILRAVGEDGQVQIQALLSLIPNLGEILHDENEGDGSRASIASSSSVEARNAAFRSLVRALGTVARPLVLFLDDLQWADSASLDLLKALLTDKASSNILYVGTYRDNEVDHNHPLSMRLREVENQVDEGDRIPIKRIQLGNLSQDTVNELVSDVLRLEPSETLSLTEVVHDRTRGNVFFVIQFLESLHDEGLLVYCYGLLKWTWDADRIRSDTTVSENVVDLMRNKIQKKLSSKERSVLTLAACFGSRFDAHLLELFVTLKITNRSFHDIVRQESKEKDGANLQTMNMPDVGDGDGIEKNLGVAVEEGLIERDMFVSSSTSYRFAHDRIHQAAYSLIPGGSDREVLHMRIGELIHGQRKLSLEALGDNTEPAVDWMLFVAADQLNIGSEQFVRGNSHKRIELAQLNLEAGKKAMHSSAFVPAASYLNKGIALIENGSQWRDHYDLTLQLYSASSSAEYGGGHFVESRKRAEAVLANAKSLGDKTAAIYTVTKFLRITRKNVEALDFCIEFSAHVGQRLPRSPSRATVKAQLFITRRMMRQMSDEEIQSLPALTEGDESSLATQMMCPLFTTVTHRLLKSDLSALTACRGVKALLRHGTCYFSPMSLVTYSAVLSRNGYYKEAYRCGMLSISLSKSIGLENTWKSSLGYFLYSCIYHWVEGHHIQECLDPLLRNYEAAMLSGDIYVAFGSVYAYSLIYVYSGLSLGGLEADMRAYCLQMREYKQEVILPIIFPVWQFVQNLMGGLSDDTVKLNGDIMTEDLLETSSKENDLLSVATIVFMQLELAYMFGNLERSARLSKLGRSYAKSFDTHFVICRVAFLDGLVSVAVAKKTAIRARRAQLLRPARRSMKQMKKWLEAGAGNVLHMLSLLSAELCSLDKRCTKEEIKKSYDEAISIAGRNGFVQDKALASERAAIFYLKSNDKDSEYWASQYMSQAHQLYLDWGAQAKADQLVKLYGSKLITTTEGCSGRENSGVGHRARSRFTDGTKTHKQLPGSVASGLGQIN